MLLILTFEQNVLLFRYLIKFGNLVTFEVTDLILKFTVSYVFRLVNLLVNAKGFT